MSALTDYRMLWNASFDHWQRTSLVFLVKVLAALLALIGVGAGVIERDWMVGVRVGIGIPMLLLLLVWTMIVPPCMALMNTPANARLVPRLRRRMIEMTTAGWLCAGAFSLLTPFWAATPLIVLWVMSMSGGRSGNRISSLMVVFAAMSGTILHGLPAQLLAFCTSGPGIVLFCVLVAVYGAWTIRSVLPNGGDKHFSQRKRQVEIIERFRSLGRKPAPGAERKPGISPYRFVLRHAVKARRSSTLMLLGLGPHTHWTSMLPFCAVIAVAGGGIHVLFGAAAGAESSIVGWVFLLTLIVIVQVAFFSSWKHIIETGRKEAVLLRLAPRCPNGRYWNRTLCAGLVRNALAFSAMAVLTTVVLALFDGASRDELVSLAAIASTLVMPGVAWMLRDQARQREESTLSWFGMLVRVIVVVVAALVALVAMLGLQITFGPLAWVMLAAASNVLGVLAALYYWSALIAAPAPFPVARSA